MLRKPQGESAAARALLLAALLVPALSSARTDVRTLAGAIRHAGCAGRPGVPTGLHANRKLDESARGLARGVTLREALMGSGYRATLSASIHIEGSSDSAALEQLLRSRFCEQLTDPKLTDLGTYDESNEVWIVAAAPFVPPAPADRARVQQRILELVNAARAHARKCGNESFMPAAPLALSTSLANAARAHSQDMAEHGVLTHAGSDGSSPADRVSRSGYVWSVVGENVAAGAATAEEVQAGWLASPEHCVNIMDPRFTELGVAYAVNARSTAGIYWSEEFGAPRPPKR